MHINNETKIGILVSTVVVILLLITFKAGNFKLPGGGYEIKAQFQNIEGVETNAPVRFNGLEVGRVKNIDIIYADVPKVELVLWINEDVKIPKGAQVLVKNMGFMGEKYIGLYASHVGDGYLERGEMIIGEEPASMEAMLANMKSISENIDQHLKVNNENIDDIFANLRVTMKNMAGITDNLNERLAVNKLLVDDTMVRVNNLSKNFEEMSYDLKLNPWKLLYKPKKKDLEKSAR